MQPFNPYHEWLGIPSGRRPASHYELLAIEFKTDDPAAIARAADALIARIRGIRPGPHLAEWQRLLDAAVGAKICLLDPTSKAAYDASLDARPGPYQPTPSERGHPGSQPPAGAPRGPVVGYTPGQLPPRTPPDPYASFGGQLQASGPAAPIAEPAPATTSPAANGVSYPAGATQGASNGFDNGFSGPGVTSTRRPKAGLPIAHMAIFVVTAALAIVGAALAYHLYQQQNPVANQRTATGPERPDGPSLSSRQSADEDQPAAAEEKQSPAHERLVPESEESGSGQESDTARARAENPADESQAPMPVDSERRKAFIQALDDARFSMSEHDLEFARRYVEQAAAAAQTQPEQAELSRLKTLLMHLEEFWVGMRRVVAGLEATEVLPVGETYIAVVEAGPEELIIKVEGQLRRYRVDQMPSSLTRALADARLADDPATKVLVGTYLAVDPDGDLARARQLWEQAAEGGVDTSELIPELDNWAGNSNSATSGSPGVSHAGGERKAALPDDPQALQQALQAVRETFQAEYDRATSLAGKADLAAELLDKSQAVDDDPIARFVMLREARDLSVSAGKAAFVCRAIQRIADLHSIDGIQMTADALTQAAKNARGINSQKELAQSTLQLIEQAVEAKRLDEAKQLTALALSAARKSNSKTLIQQVMVVARQVETLDD